MSAVLLIVTLVTYFLVIPFSVLLGVLWIIRQRRFLKKLRTLGIEVDAEIIQRSSYQLPKGQAHVVKYRFRPNLKDENAIYTCEQEVGHRHFHHLRIGTHVTILYLPTDPSVSKLASANRDELTEYRVTLYVAVFIAVWLTVLLIGLGNLAGK